jgi:acyl-CoA thioesterase-1
MRNLHNPWKTVLAAILLAAALRDAPVARAACPPAPVQALALPHLRAALAKHEPVVIVALGSSSTQGAMATDTGDSYPAELQDDLSRLLPRDEISVINRGIGGQDAGREDARMGADVLALRPDLVIWQVGANAAARREQPSHFARLVRLGLRRLRAADADIVLMENQRSRILLASGDDAPINAALARLARRHKVGLFSRDALMRAWVNSGAKPEALLAPDGLHMNDRGYACLARALAQSIYRAVTSR